MEKIKGEILLYITPPDKTYVIDNYFSQGASRVACSLEVLDDKLAASITPGKREFTTKERHFDALTYIAEKGIIPSASIWMHFCKPVNGSMKAPDVEYLGAVKEILAELYTKYDLSSAGDCGLNVCVERDIKKMG